MNSSRICTTLWRSAGRIFRGSTLRSRHFYPQIAFPDVLKHSVRIVNINAEACSLLRPPSSSFSSKQGGDSLIDPPEKEITDSIAKCTEEIEATKKPIKSCVEHIDECVDDIKHCKDDQKEKEQQLRTDLQQLRTKEQQLRTDLQQLRTKEQQLRTDLQQLRDIELSKSKRDLSARVGSLIKSSPEYANEPTDMSQYIEVAEKLLLNGYYDAFIQVIGECHKSKNHTFIVLDCPSGSGKTLAGVALRLLDTHLESGDFDYKVAHVIWPSAIDAQSVYRSIHKRQEMEGIYASEFYQRGEQMVRSLQIPSSAKSSEIINHVWKECLQYIFRHECEDDWDLEKFKLKYKVKKLILFMDEIPTNAEQVAMVGRIRDYCKMDKNVILILAGTNSKAANMIGLTNKDASAKDPAQDNAAWSFLVTRLPAFVPQYSVFHDKWKVLSESAKGGDHEEVVKAISTSISGRGNPRLINFAIDAAAKLADRNEMSFSKWQRELAKMNCSSKFTLSRYSSGFDVLVGQSNLLLEAAADHTKADVLMRGHYAQRASPNGYSIGGTVNSSRMEDCGGWLQISEGRHRGVGHQLYMTVPDNPAKKVFDWQVTVFHRPSADPLLYLACCMDSGFLSYNVSIRDDEFKQTQVLAVKYTALEVMRWLWSSDAFGFLNFQNLSAPLNTGKYLETLATLAVFNAASEGDAELLTLEDFLIGFIRQLGHTHNNLEPFKDRAFQGPRVPRIVLPGDAPPSQYIGSLLRVANDKRIDLILQNIQGLNGLGHAVSFLRIEVKDRNNFSIGELAEAAPKVVQNDGEIGVIVVRNCTEKWFDTGIEASKVGRFSDSHIGTIHFIHSSGLVHSQILSKAKKGRLIVIQYEVPPLWIVNK